MTDAQLWENLKRQIKTRYHATDFVCEILAKLWSDIEQQYSVTEETKSLDTSYLAFLDKQIELEPRGKDWTRILRTRRDALWPYVGRVLTTLSITTSEGVIVIKFCYDDNSLVLFEWQQ